MMETLKDYILNQVAEKKLPTEQAAAYLASITKSFSPSTQVTYAVIGMACRFPGADTLDEFWENLMNRRDCVGAFPKMRIADVQCVSRQTYQLFHGLQCRIGGYLDRIDGFDHSFFNITPAEARVMDPSQRIFLEVAVEALEHAGLTEKELRGSKTGIFVGYSINEDNYIDILPKDDPNIALGNQPSVLAYRLSFLYDMRGPTMLIDTACSSSLVALHQACQAIAAGDCNQAIVGGVNLRIFPAIRAISNLGIEAFDGRCKTFDQKANGTNIGDGIAAVIVKRKDLAEKDGDYIHAVIQGSAVNSDGNANGITVPNPEAQEEVLKAAWQKACIHPGDISFIETHGTGTKLGDPIEVLALTHAFADATNKKQFCPLGAVKTNIGHLEATSGLAGFIKAILCLQHRQLPPNIHYQIPNPYIDFKNAPVFPAEKLINWENRSQKCLAGVSSFGISGTNCHCVVEEYQQNHTNKKLMLTDGIFLFSVKQKESLVPLLEKYWHWLNKHPQCAINDLSYTLACGRDHYDHRIAFVANDLIALMKKIKLFTAAPMAETATHPGIYSDVKIPPDAPELVHLYLQKVSIYWARYFPHGFGRKIPLPTYAFHRRRHWPNLEIKKDHALQENIHELFYQLEWKEASSDFAASPLNDRTQQRFLFFIRAYDAHEAFANFVEAQGIPILRVYPAETFSIQQQQCHIPIDNPLDYDRLITWILNDRSHDFGGIVHLWDCIPVSNTMEHWENMKQSQYYGTFSVFHLIRSLQQKYPQGAWKLINITAYAQKVKQEDPIIDPTRMPLLGINKVASQEMPLVQSLVIDTVLTESLFDTLFQEIFNTATYTEAVVSYRKGRRYIQTLARKYIDTIPTRSVSIRKNGVYLIAGGAGYLGLQTARLLAAKESVHIVLTGRKSDVALTQKQKSIMQEIEKLGSTVMYLQCDVTHLQSCQHLITTIEEKWGVIHGIFVAIKNISHKRLEAVTFEEFSTNILSKIQGTGLLDSLTKHLPVDFMATFSSISSLTGGPTGADCSASNLFLDSFGEWRNDQGRSTITMNYTLIEADDGSLLSDRMSMIPPISKEEFLACLDLCLTKNIDFAVMANFNSRVMNLVLPFMKIKFSTEIAQQFQAAQAQQTTPQRQAKTDLTLSEITGILQTIWKEVLGHDTVDPKANFFEIGGESISAVKLLHLIHVQLQVPLEIADLYAYPILEDLAHFIAGTGQQ